MLPSFADTLYLLKPRLCLSMCKSQTAYHSITTRPMLICYVIQCRRDHVRWLEVGVSALCASRVGPGFRDVVVAFDNHNQIH